MGPLLLLFLACSLMRCDALQGIRFKAHRQAYRQRPQPLPPPYRPYPKTRTAEPHATVVLGAQGEAVEAEAKHSPAGIATSVEFHGNGDLNVLDEASANHHDGTEATEEISHELSGEDKAIITTNGNNAIITTNGQQVTLKQDHVEIIPTNGQLSIITTNGKDAEAKGFTGQNGKEVTIGYEDAVGIITTNGKGQVSLITTNGKDAAAKGFTGQNGKDEVISFTGQNGKDAEGREAKGFTGQNGKAIITGNAQSIPLANGIITTNGKDLSWGATSR